MQPVYIEPTRESTHLSNNVTSSSSCDVESQPYAWTPASRFSYDNPPLKQPRPWRKKGHKKLFRMAGVFVAYSIAILVINSIRAFNGESSHEESILSELFSDLDISDRVRRDALDSNFSKEPFLLEETTTRCIPRSVGNFPGNFMTRKDTRNGGCFTHILIAIYMFAALAVVCDDYFVPSLEHICESLRLQADVAGATFMAAGSSAPEFMTSVIGVFIARSDVGVGTIVGSAVFNILFIIGVCGLFAGMVSALFVWYSK